MLNSYRCNVHLKDLYHFKVGEKLAGISEDKQNSKFNRIWGFGHLNPLQGVS